MSQKIRDPVEVFLGLGSNIGDRLSFLRRALYGLSASPCVFIRKVSSIYETEPVGYEDQEWFLNAVAAVQWYCEIHEILSLIRSIEYSLGRRRSVRCGPRTIDIDIISIGNVIIYEPELQVPHPRISERRFVLEPLAEVDSGWQYPGSEVSVVQLLLDCKDNHIVRKVDSPEALWAMKR